MSALRDSRRDERRAGDVVAALDDPPLHWPSPEDERPPAPRFKPWERVAAVVLPPLLAGLAAFGAWAYVVGSERDAFRSQAEAIFAQISKHLGNAEALITSITTLHQGSEALDSTQLTAISAEFISRNAYVASVGYAQTVRGDERAEFEREMVTQGYTGFRIRDPGPAGRRGPPAGERDWYHALAFVEPLTPMSATRIGVDLAADEGTRAALWTAAESGEIASASTGLLHPERPLHVLLRATYYGHFAPDAADGRLDQLSGVYLLALDLDRLLADIEVRDPGVSVALVGIPGHQPGAALRTVRRAADHSDGLPAWMPVLETNRRLEHGDAPLDIVVRQESVSVEEPLGLVALVFVLALFVASAVALAVRERRIVAARDELARERLMREREEAQVTLESIGDGVITADHASRILYLNPVAETLTGWRSTQARGRPLESVVDLVREGNLDDVPLADRDDLATVDGDARLLLRARDDSTLAVDCTVSHLRGGDDDDAGTVIVIRDVSRERELANELAHQAAHDPLTGLANRRHFELRLRDMLDSAQRSSAVHALCYIDLDQFKIVNDTCGHAAGDQLLKQVTRELRAEMRENDLLARLGGDEFGVLLAGCPLGRAREIAERLRVALDRFRFHHDGRLFEVTASIGLVAVDASSGSVGDVQSAADLACYAAKERGRNCVHVFQPGDEVVSRQASAMQWQARIKAALDEDRFVLHWQLLARLSARSGPGEMREFLVRMVDEDGAEIEPMRFIPAAERYALMPRLDRWVIRHAFEAIRDTETQLGDTLYTINLSGQTLGETGLAEFVLERLADSGVPGSVVCFEITETAAISNYAQAIEIMETLKREGCRFALDDFGAGVSSFGYLKRLPVDFLKIDGQFVRDMTRDPVNFAMVKSIDGIGKVLNIATVAERVEDGATLDMLRTIGIDYAQGYYLGRPEPVRPPAAEMPVLRLVR